MDNAFGQPQRVIVLGGSSEIARAITKKLLSLIHISEPTRPY